MLKAASKMYIPTKSTLELVYASKRLMKFAWPFVAFKVWGKIVPVLAGYKITNKCNLKCSHCPFWKRSGPEQDFQGVIETMRKLREMGIRILILEGGEPLIWSDGSKNFSDVVLEARKLFPCVCMTTNGLLSWADLPLDRVWVSLDGPRSVHDSIRGEGVFDKAIANMKRDTSRRVLVSTTISTINLHATPELISILKGIVKGVTIQFYYPYGGLPDPLYVEHHQRQQLLDELIKLKRAGYPVANSISSLLEMKKEIWTCIDELLANAEPDGSIARGCYLKNRGNAVCSNCGFTAHNEMSLAFKGVWESIKTGAEIFFLGHPLSKALPQ